MNRRQALWRLLQQENVNFLLTNRIPRRWLTVLAGRISKLEQPWIRSTSIALWKLLCDVDMSDARPVRYRSLHDCFVRELLEGARPVDPDAALMVSPCDGIVGACGRISDGMVLQAKGFPYPLADLLGDAQQADIYRHGSYVTLRLTAGMYHRFHAPHDCHVEQVNYISGDTWNVNPIALKRVERLFCRNERAIIRCRLSAGGQPFMLVPVAAILVASIRLHFVNVLLHLRYRGPNVIPCDVAVRKGQELGWFEHGSTIIVFVPAGTTLYSGVYEGARLRMGQPLLRLGISAPG